MSDTDSARVQTSGAAEGGKKPPATAADSTARVTMETLPSAPIRLTVVEDLYAMVAAEVAGAQTAEEGDALRVRAALLAWDGLDDRARAIEALADAEHPLAPALRLGLGQLPDRDERSTSDVDQAVLAAHQFARGAYAEAAELAERAGPVGALVRRIALGLLGGWDELVRDAERDDGHEQLEEASAVALDRLTDQNGAHALLRRLYDAGPHPYVIERLLELDDADDNVLVGILRAKLQRIEPSATPERAATAYLLARALEVTGDEAEAESHLAALATGSDGATLGLAMLAQRSLARLAAKRGDWQRAADAWEALARDSGSPTFAGAYLRRAAELWDARVGAAERAEPIYARLHEADPGDAALASALVRLLVRRGAPGEIGAVLGRLGGSREEGTQGALLMAATLEELSGGDPQRSRAHWQMWADALAASQADHAEAARANALEGIARALRATAAQDPSTRAQTRGELIEHYRTHAIALDAVRGAAYLAAAGSLALEEGLTDVAASLFDEAASREPNDLLVHAGRAILFERTGRNAELSAALQALTRLVESTTAQATIHKKLARVSVESLNDVATAHDSYERLLELEPENVTVIESFVRLCAEGGKWARAVELIDRGAAIADGDRAATMLCYAGELTERHLSDDDAARGYYERALERSRGHAGALSGLAAQHKKFNRLEPYLVALKALLDLEPARERRIELLLEYARAAERADGAAASHDYGRAFAGYDEALRLEPGQPVAMQGLERLCRASSRWEELAEAYARAPESLRGVRVRAECMEHLERWGELAKVRETELKLLEAPAEIAAAARALADLYEARLHNPEAAVRAWMRVAEAAPAEAEPLRAVARLHEAAGRHPALATIIERELALGDALEVGRRVELWTKLGELRRGPLAQPAPAAEAYEEALRLEPGPTGVGRPELVEQLIELYKTLGRGNDLSRMLDARAATANNPQQRANVIREKAELREREGDVAGALQAYQQSFTLDPESRACFTSYEKLCYKAERWKQALELYEAAIALVEEKKSRAYRLADLYARRGQLQLQYLGALGEATASYKRVLELDPENDVSQTALERIFSTQADWRGLIEVYEHRAELVKTDARRVEVLRRAARVAGAKMHDAAEAARLYERLLAVDPTDAEATDTLERYYEREHNTERLVAILRTRLMLTAGGEEAIALHLRIAQLCEEGLRDAGQTIDAYQKILEISPSNREAIDALGRLYEGTERWAELVEVTRRQIRLVTDRAQKALLYFKCGSVMESKFSKEDDAIRYYDAAIKTSPSCLPAVHGLRDLYLRRQEWARVIQTLELEAKLWTEDKERAGVFAHIGQIYGERLADPERAIQYYETALQVDRECLPANKALFDLYSARGDYQQALTLAVVLTQKVAREGDPVERSEFYRKRSIVAERTGDLRAAVDSLVVALEIRPENLEALDMLVSLCRAAPDAYDYETTFRELEKLHRKRDSTGALARVLVAQASLLELAYDVDAAEEAYLSALKMAPMDFTVVEPLVALNERLRRFDQAEALMEAFLDRCTDPAARTFARLRLAQLFGDAMMDDARAAATLAELIEEDPSHREGQFLYAQELYLLGRYAEARQVADRLIALATSPEHTAPPEELARYYDYQGRILEAAGDQAASGRAFRRAIDLDPTYPPACLALARRAAATGDLGQGTRLLAEALEAAETEGNVEASLTLQRSRARFLVTWGELALAAEAFHTLLERAPDSIDDRLAYADLLGRSEQTIMMAFGEIERVLSIEPRHSQAYRQLAQLYIRVGQTARSVRVYSLMALMGILDPADRPPTVAPVPRRGVITDELRGAYAGSSARGPLTEALLAVREALEQPYPFVVPPDAVPVSQLNDVALRNHIQDLERVFGVAAEVYVAPSLGTGFVVTDLPKPAIYLSQATVELPDQERRVLLGAALEALRGGYAILTRVDANTRAAVTNLVEQLLRPESERSPDAQSYVKALPRKAQKALEKLWGMKSKTVPPGLLGGTFSDATTPSLPTPSGNAAVTIETWLAELERAMHRAGLVACDDLSACCKVFIRSVNAEAATTQPVLSWRGDGPPRVSTTEKPIAAPVVDDLLLVGDAVLALDRGPKMTELVSFYLSEPYHLLRSTIGEGN